MTDTFIVTLTLPEQGEGLMTILTPSNRLETRRVGARGKFPLRSHRDYVEDKLIQMYPIRKGSMHGSRQVWSSAFTPGASTQGMVLVFEVEFDTLWGPRADEDKGAKA